MLEHIVNVKNRVNRTVEWMYDGQVYILQPLEEKPMLVGPATHGRKKTKYGFDGATWHYQLGIIEFGHDCDPIEPKEAPDQWIDPLHRKDEPLQDAAGIPLEIKKFSNPDLALSRPTSGGGFHDD